MSGTPAAPEATPAERPTRTRRRGRPTMGSEDRRRVMDALGVRSGSAWKPGFWLMTTLSVTVATMGLSSDSAAVVIGAMLLAPLMSPVLAIAASIAMALPRPLWRELAVVAVATAWSVLAAVVLATLLPDDTLPGEVLARTSPDLRDLVVALAAGAAGAYATVREDVSSALPGVAVAVALVPPLASVGIALEAGEPTLAKGAALLYVANLIAIVLIATVVFLATGFVPARRLAQTRGRVVLGGAVAAVATVAIAIPLTVATVDAARAGNERDRVRDAVEDWLRGSGDEIDAIDLEGGRVVINVSGPNPPPPTMELERAVEDAVGPGAVAEVRWTQTQRSSTSPDDAAEELTAREAAEREAAVREVVDAWLASETTSFDVDELAADGDEIRLDLTSADPPPPVDDLVARLDEDLGIATPVVVNWTQRTTLTPEDPEQATLADTRQRLAQVAADWATDRDGVAVESLTWDGEVVTVDLTGPDPGDVADLASALAEEVDADAEVEIWFVPRVRLTPTTGGG
ncbi:MAG: DUF389 domain-containing protein [Acidimicrobiales bacterium]|nr:DUF389 domain-containing protein [Acidimicrobiales bacterium]